MMSKIPFSPLLVRFLRWLIPLMVLSLVVQPHSLSAHGAGLEADVRYRPAPPVAGEPLTFDVTLSYADDEDALQSGRVFIAASGPENASVRAVELMPSSAEGQWTGQVVLPTDGVWTMEIRVELPGGTAQDRYNMQVAPAGTAPGDESGHFGLELDVSPTPAAGQPLWLRYWPLGLGALIVAGLVLAFLFLPAAQPKDVEHST